MPTTYLDILATNRKGVREASTSMPFTSVQGGKLPGEGKDEKASVGASPKPYLQQQRLMIKAGL